MGLLLGIDTGGTYTDAVLLDSQGGVQAAGKALTTRHDLALGIDRALESVLGGRAREVALVGLSTTLATNALVEGQGSPICLLLLGYHYSALERASLRQALGDDPVCFASGGHDAHGRELAPLDHAAIREAVERHGSRVGAFAVSGQFGVRNPEHELAAMHLIRELSGLPVSCGHQLSFALHAPRRALTAALNARLIPLIADLMEAVRRILDRRGVAAPLMVVRGDGSLVSEQVASLAPVETILSGPAASVTGARHLSGLERALVADMGGTTTDIAIVLDGQPALSEEGATVAGWHTMVRAIRVHTFGLGGDSEVCIESGGRLQIGPRRVLPLCALADQSPAVREVLREQASASMVPRHGGRFAFRIRSELPGRRLSSQQRKLWDRLSVGARPIAQLLTDASLERPLERLVGSGLVGISAFTPTDAAHVLGIQDTWPQEASKLGADLHARVLDVTGGGVQFAQRIVERVQAEAARYLALSTLGHEGARLPDSTIRDRMLDQAVGIEPEPELLSPRVRLKLPVAGVGAPAALYLVPAAKRLESECGHPPFGAVANAVGAVVGSVVWRAVARIIPESDTQYRVHSGSGVMQLGDLEGALAWARTEAERQAVEGARAAGAVDIQVRTERHDTVCRDDMGLELLLEAEITAVATGRPKLAG